MSDIEEGDYVPVSVESFLEIQEIINKVAESYIPDYGDYDGFWINEETQEVEISYSYELSCDCCSYDYGQVEVPIKEFNEKIQRLSLQ